MNIAVFKKALPPRSNPSYIHQRLSLFHSTIVLARRKPNRYVNVRKCDYKKRYERDSVVDSINAYTDYLFKSWRDNHKFYEDRFSPRDSTNSFGRDYGNGKSSPWESEDGEKPYYWSSEDESNAIGGPSWFKKEFETTKNMRNKKKGSQKWGRGSFACESDVEIDIDDTFESSHPNGYYYWSFVNEANYQWKRKPPENHGRAWDRGHKYEKAHEYNHGSANSNLGPTDASERVTLGLSIYGTLNLEDVKAAYRSCALKWHPDRHQGSSKAVAEEKFKVCSAAYQALCDKLEVN